jgi:phosphopantetheinyl transferase
MCRIPSNGSNYYCSVSHDDRFAIAVASFNPIGVDVERVSTKTVKGKHLFMNEEEQKMVRISHLGIRDASSRVWSIKEAAAKALDITLTESWKKVKVVSLGEEKSDILINDQQVIAYHAKVDDHIITLLKLQKIGGLD